ncbi:HAD family acid phosphatase [Streptomyces sp. 8N114]|uniref:HAD family acid phosphatase n=1 Tax=Streptomyces sp. 8N114 TaxID=3457419 RepID=UPI003FCF4297
MPRSLRSVLSLVAVAAVAGTAFFGVGQATADHAAPRTDKEIPNLDQVKTKIEAYYGDIETPDGEHYASPHSNYAKQTRGIAAKARKDLERDLRKYDSGHGSAAGSRNKPAVVLDVDDTTLLTYNFEREIGYHFTPQAQDEYLRTKNMDPVFGMRKLVNWAHSKGVTVFLVTGRKEYQRDWSVRNLKKAGYKNPVGKDRFFLKNEEHPPPYLDCGSDCTTVEYKSGTRKHIEGRGYDILANFGDQYSDLKGGYADRKVKLPNPMYYLP